MDLATIPPVYSLLHDFSQFIDTETLSHASLVQATDKKFYGTTYNGGSNNFGTIFQLDTATTPASVKELHNFNNTEGAYPLTTLVESSLGQFYGATYSGGLANSGLIYGLNNTGSSPVYSVVHQFSFDEYVVGRLIKGRDGHLYGVTNRGGRFKKGSIFRIRLDVPPPPPANTAPVAKNDSFVLTLARQKKQLCSVGTGRFEKRYRCRKK